MGLAASVIAVTSCSTKKDALLNRKWHAMNAKYNAIYNGKNALAEGRQDLISNYRDNYWDILPVERMEVRDEVVLDGTELTPNFERAEEKAVKAIQKHGMNIGGSERNTQIDEAYLLLGKARYYDQRFIPALEAFNYVLNKYRNSDIIGQALIWREKTHIRLENDELAIENLKKLLKYAAELDDQDYADANAMMAQAYINLKHKDSALQRLKTASLYTGDAEEKGRYYFIIGQLYNELGYLDSANYAFDKVIDLNRRTSRVYHVNARIFKIRNLYDKGYDKEELLELLTKMEKNRENRPYLGMVYRQSALYHEDQDSLDLARLYYNKSLRAESRDPILNERNYRALGKMAFDARDYTLAGAYYDSTLSQMAEKSKEYRLLKRQRDNLQEVIAYEGVRKRNDSILNLLAMTPENRLAYFENYIDSLKKEEAIRRERERVAELQKNSGGGGLSLNNSGGADGFYFYNTSSVAYGKQEFQKIWGNISLTDNWKYGKQQIKAGESVVNTEIASGEAAADIYDPDFYLTKLPEEPEKIDSIQQERDLAYYQLGLLYKERFREYMLAADRLQDLLGYYPEERLVLPAKYNLYRIYLETESPLAEAMKADILSNYPDSRYAQYILDPSAFASDNTDDPERNYNELYRRFEAQEFEEVIAQAGDYSRKYNGEDIGVKFELLKANAMGRLYGVDALKRSLTELSLNHPSKPEGIRAAELLENNIPKLETLDFPSDEEALDNWKVVYVLKKTDTTALEDLRKKVERSLVEVEQRGYTYSVDVYDRQLVFLVIHNAGSRLRAEGFAEFLAKNKDYLVDIENFVISRDAYKVIQIKKNLDDYLLESGQAYPNLN
ncbi:type IX secretion system periplasmic lipoprotein PorW/SprE [Robertkochia flava]|uniref:type IX secretion system periplasmic lipoprotein PorW/SprE n=1 Tax=Robertkochia flava TaxID=3447986 RepID=UPI001CCD5CEF|nr:hypothetical protein [Robertkochia marina]